MKRNNYSSQPVVEYNDLLQAMSKISKEEIDETVKKARQLGIPEDKIQQGLQIINNIKKQLE